MNERQTFLRRLKAGLKGMPRPAIDDIMADYEGHFDAGLAAGRSEADVAAALGNPSRLARELRAEAGLRRWEDERSLASALGVIVGVLGLAALDLFIVLPLLVAAVTTVFSFFIAGVGICLGGSLALPFAIITNFPGFAGDRLQAVLLSMGLLSGGASLVAFCILFTIGLVNVLARYGRAHYRLIAADA
ncbi:protein of unknown function DUF1700 [Gluconacetobacter diazotrophicus PA1 5]|uniref:Uncharacterized protein n=2 Tax=Gluconacetobacter diazotrophicus TaxID=33996 RepID=A9HJK9_GLUDA|nr:DUF1700 domain-containing protein [Gluconacetobacter diazotrophicus]ACI50001.1 protein of unknown function DUF1700 [Gluconacetobacter diazotrophicus PA1 5]MBB2157326.1 DUF1700 domain-containing protein [Gluconacetobacter diazotrophicus]TWB07921.1 putative membrane protein [Gluconacetobacter diazotrophicus]CAP55920.1 conserved hypothetical protein [Gluconacetobacter diazotrophicus PA1 5]